MTSKESLDAIIAVEYKVNLKQATKIRKLDTHTLTEFITKVFVSNGKMLKDGNLSGESYLGELVENKSELSHEMAVKKAHEEYYKFRVIQDKLNISGFDKKLKSICKVVIGSEGMEKNKIRGNMRC